MSESKGAIHKMPQWSKWLLLAAIIVAVPIGFSFDAPAAVWALVGPMFLIHMWTAGKFGFYTREDHPALFWIVFCATVLVSIIGLSQLISALGSAMR